jgi:hypothetical protein
VDAEEDSASGARIFDPNDELLRYTMPVPVRGFAWAILGDGMGEDGGEDGDGTLLESCAEVSEGVRSPKREGCWDDEGIEGTGTAARSPLSRVPAWRGSWSGRTAGDGNVLPAGAGVDEDCDAVAEKVRARGNANFETGRAPGADGVDGWVSVGAVTVEVEAELATADGLVPFDDAVDGVFFKPPSGNGGSDLFLLNINFWPAGEDARKVVCIVPTEESESVSLGVVGIGKLSVDAVDDGVCSWSSPEGRRSGVVICAPEYGDEREGADDSRVLLEDRRDIAVTAAAAAVDAAELAPELGSLILELGGVLPPSSVANEFLDPTLLVTLVRLPMLVVVDFRPCHAVGGAPATVFPCATLLLLEPEIALPDGCRWCWSHWSNWCGDLLTTP